MNSSQRVTSGQKACISLFGVTAVPFVHAHAGPPAGTEVAAGMMHVLAEPVHGFLLWATAVMIAAATERRLRSLAHGSLAHAAWTLMIAAGLAFVVLGFAHLAGDMAHGSYAIGVVLGAAIVFTAGAAFGLRAGAMRRRTARSSSRLPATGRAHPGANSGARPRAAVERSHRDGFSPRRCRTAR